MVGGDFKNWIVCYSYGDYNTITNVRLSFKTAWMQRLGTKMDEVDVAILKGDKQDSIFKRRLSNNMQYG